ncbi:MAG: tRNA 2-thiouridine(34) synthase MnmA [Holosporales bacterium]|jgi:tRNA-specific 2-thiouridylase|nr:tRNA 2-thiouridine(34) synthase MnmA [Holosporales bacterium]
MLSSISGSNERKTVYAVAMSGGVDSSVVAAVLQSRGHDVFGITMDIHENCLEDIEDAQKVCAKLGIPHYVFDVRAEYQRKVIDLFVDYYARGLTPNPCAFCNRDLKLNILVDYARGMGAELMATGHYSNLAVDSARVLLSEAANLAKDQSYFVSLAPRHKLHFTRFPLGNIENKEQTRAMAQEFGLPNFKKDDSQDICFIRQGTYKEFLRNLKTNLNLFAPGHIKLRGNDQIIGEHDGLANYTIGQRRGLGISHGDPLYVVGLDPDNREVLVGNREDLVVSEFTVCAVNWLLDMDDEFEAFVKIRSFGIKTKAKIMKNPSGDITIKFLGECKTPVTQGQVCAMYNLGNQVIGAGIISARK